MSYLRKLIIFIISFTFLLPPALACGPWSYVYVENSDWTIEKMYTNCISADPVYDPLTIVYSISSILLVIVSCCLLYFLIHLPKFFFLKYGKTKIQNRAEQLLKYKKILRRSSIFSGIAFVLRWLLSILRWILPYLY